MDILKDENGKFSASRLSFFLVLAVTLWLMVTGAQRSTEAWKLLTDLLLALPTWAATPRVMQHLAKLRTGVSDEPATPPVSS